jgi:hypothetical protein
MFSSSLFTADEFYSLGITWPTGKDLSGRFIFVLTGNAAKESYRFDKATNTQVAMNSKGNVVEVHTTLQVDFFSSHSHSLFLFSSLLFPFRRMK